jgi:arylsulfatase A-like enzyme
LLLLLLTFVSSDAMGSRQSAAPPNFLIIISDDQRYDTMDFMPHTKARIFDEGITFTSAFVTTPLCSPSRASIFTGMYAHKHGVLGNGNVLKKKTFAERLHENGYYTGLVGKYMNVSKGTPRPEFDYWLAHEDGVSRYFDPWLNTNGTWSIHPGYITHILRDSALAFIRRAEQQEKPFLLIFAPNAPHDPSNPAPGDESLYPNLPPHRPPSFDEADVSDKPAWVQNRSPITTGELAQIDAFRLKQLQSLNALDKAIDSLLTTLAEQQKLDNTFVLYISDNGFFWGEHRLRGKNFVYEEAAHVPMALRYPALVKTPRLEEKLVANIDIAPTIYELAGIDLPPEMDGRSLVPLLNATDKWRNDLLIEGWPGPLYTTYAAVRTEHTIYVENENERPEYYDLIADPYQLENLADNPANAAAVAALKTRLTQLKGINTSVKNNDASQPENFYLRQNFPNPFSANGASGNPATTIHFSLPRRAPVTLKVFDQIGKEVATLVDEELAAGEHKIVFEAQGLPSGFYLYRLLTPTSLQTKSMLLIK